MTETKKTRYNMSFENAVPAKRIRLLRLGYYPFPKTMNKLQPVAA